MNVEEAAVVRHLRIRVKSDDLLAFKAFVKESLPAFEAGDECRGVVYACTDDPEAFEEVFYYRTEEAYEAARSRLEDGPCRGLMAQWRGLLAAPPEEVVCRRFLR